MGCVRGRADTKTPTKCRGEKPDAARFAAPSGRGDARQALSELRRIVDAARHRIRRKFIRVRHKRRRHESHIRDPQRLRCERSDNLMANALAAIATARSLVLRNRLPMLCLGRFAVAAAVSKKIEAISRRHEQGDDDNE